MSPATSRQHQQFTIDGPVAVVGANCPLGRHLVDFLLASGRSVHGFCRFGWSIPWQWKVNRAFQSTEFTLEGAAALARSLESANQIVWLLQLRDEYDCGGNVDPNVEALHLVCSRQSRRARKIVLLSSGGSVYGNPEFLPVAETHPCRPIGSYGWSKKRLEDSLSQDIGHTPGLSGVILRSANIYGDYWLESGTRGCIAAFARSLLANERVTLIAGGRAVRDFVHVSDINRAIMLALACEQSLAVWNVGSGTGVQVFEVLRTMSQILGRVPAGFIQLDARPSDIGDIFLDVGKIRRECSWRTRISLYKGLKSVLRPRQSSAAAA